MAYVLPNLPETHFVIWGAEAAGIIFAINPLLDPAHIGEILKAANAKVLVCWRRIPTPICGSGSQRVAATARLSVWCGVAGRFARTSGGPGATVARRAPRRP